jgi:hypothetical protein
MSPPVSSTLEPRFLSWIAASAHSSPKTGVAHDAGGAPRADGKLNGQTSTPTPQKNSSICFTNIRNYANVFGLTKASCQNSGQRAMRLVHF